MLRKTAVMVAATLSLAAGALAIPQRVSAADPIPPFIPADANWLDTVNYYRQMASVGTTTGALASVLNVPSWSTGAYNHSCYMIYNGITHDEISSKPGYTPSGDAAGNNGNVAVSTTYNTSARKHIELWMTGPFHAIGVLRHQLRQVGFGKCDVPTSSTGWRSAATLDILSDLQYRAGVARPTQPILWPGNGTTTNLSAFVTESPNPLNFCGWTGSAGLPVIAMMPEPVGANSAFSVSMTGPSGPLQVCGLHSGNITSGGTASSRQAARDILAYDNAVTVVPRTVLSPGVYTTTVRTQFRTVTWSFTVDPTAETGIMPIPQVEPAGPLSAFTPITPFRFGDSRQNLRISTMIARSVKKVKVAGVAGLPTDIKAVSANLTVYGPDGPGFLTAYNCSSTVPNASSVNYTTGRTVPNAGVIPLSSDGHICFYSPANTHLIIDISGYFRNDAASGYQPMAPAPLLNTDTSLNSTGRMTAGQTIEIDVPDANIGVPSNATAVALIITGKNASGSGFMTAYPCGSSMPGVSNLNPVPSASRTNSALVALPTSGKLCLFSWAAVDASVDVVGYFTSSGSGRITPVVPTRVIDTREVYRPLMNFNQGGAKLRANTTYTLDLAGERGIPSNATAVSINAAVVTPSNSGHLLVTPCSTAPDVKSLTYMSSFTVNTGMQVKLSTAGTLCVRPTTDVHVVIDVTGYWT